MQNQEEKEYKILDWLILSFFVIFILSLSNSIFVNQIGYFGALFFILVKAFLTRKNQFARTGLELAFALYMIAEIVSLIFTEYKGQAFHYFTKRALLIPIVYTTIAVTSNWKRGKNFFILFIAGALITAIIYLVISIQFYFSNQYAITQSGPSIFQHPITASEIISFIVLFLFAFIVNEKTDWKSKLLIYAGFAISTLMLVATFKRTGWIGVGAGIFLILIMKGKWKILLPLFIAVIILFLLDKNISQVSVYDFKGSGANKLYSFNTDGRATAVSRFDSMFIVCDYENGILFYEDSTLVKKVETPEPIVLFSETTDSIFLAYLINTRILVFKKYGEELKQVNEILPPGETKDFALIGQSLYTLDSDSGLTYYESLTDQSKPIRFPELIKYRWFFIDSAYFYFASEHTGVVVHSREGKLPGKKVLSKEVGDINRAFMFNGKLLLSNSSGLKLFSIENNDLILKDQVKQLKQVHRISGDSEVLAILTGDGSVYKFKIDDKDKFELITQDKISPKPTNFYYADGKLYCTYVNRGRLLSFFDQYLPQNFTRLALWRAGWEIFKDYPLFGVGDIGIEKYYVKYKRPYDKEIHGHLHNNYFHFLATLGLFGLLSLMFLFVMIIITILRIYKSTKGKSFIASYSLGALASFVSILISGLTELNFWDQEIATLIYFTVGLNIALYICYKKEIEES
ncbi:MAG: O-antigen ligase family protein [Ignavibacteriaceae bacterium]|nr:O-antigen ligase family protein [Ignavibacteriaceae bacterium]